MSAARKRDTDRNEGTAPAEMRDRDASDAFSLHARPGFLVRRLHQIHVALFFEECAAFGITPVQYSVLSALRERGPLGQASLAREVGLDRTNVAEVVRRLAGRGLIVRSPSPTDQRMRMARLSGEGAVLVRSMAAAAQRAHERTIAPLPPAQRRAFVAALQRLVEANNGIGRAPMGRAAGGTDAGRVDSS